MSLAILMALGLESSPSLFGSRAGLDDHALAEERFVAVDDVGDLAAGGPGHVRRARGSGRGGRGPPSSAAGRLALACARWKSPIGRRRVEPTVYVVAVAVVVVVVAAAFEPTVFLGGQAVAQTCSQMRDSCVPQEQVKR